MHQIDISMTYLDIVNILFMTYKPIGNQEVHNLIEKLSYYYL